MKFGTGVTILTLSLILVTFSIQAQVLERDPLNTFTVSRPVAWTSKERPSPAIRVMLEVEGNGYVGSCNISVLSSSNTVNMTQAKVDVSENKRNLGVTFFQSQLSDVAQDVKVQSVVQRRRGVHLGHLINYSYSYVSPALQRRIHVRAELFSHSRPGKVFSFTCNTGALSAAVAQRAFSKESKSFENLSTSLRVDA